MRALLGLALRVALTGHRPALPQTCPRRLYAMTPPSPPPTTTAAATGVRHLSQKEATDVDRELFDEYRFSVDQLMELAGLSCAVAVARHFPPRSGPPPAVLVVCGPGNNGGDGLVCARHLRLFGFAPTVYYSVQKDVPLYTRLAHQCRTSGVPVLDSPPSDAGQFQLMVDALFGFSFRPPVRDSLAPALRLLVETSAPVASVDVPSGWHVEDGPDGEAALRPALLVSLTAPKRCARHFSGAHYLGGRFVPPALAEKYDMRLPEYPGTDCVVRLDGPDEPPSQ